MRISSCRRAPRHFKHSLQLHITSPAPCRAFRRIRLHSLRTSAFKLPKRVSNSPRQIDRTFADNARGVKKIANSSAFQKVSPHRA